jgi:hypothetical protein
MSNTETALERTFAILELMKDTLDSQVDINAQVMQRLEALEQDYDALLRDNEDLKITVENLRR